MEREAQNGALQTRDRSRLRARNDPGSAVHRYALHRVREKGLGFGLQAFGMRSNASYTRCSPTSIGGPLLRVW
jgi:hypothetical protein